MDKPRFSTEYLRSFAADGRAYRAFGYVIFAHQGSLLLVPQQQITDLSATIDGCPVPHDEVLAIQNDLLEFTMETPVQDQPQPMVRALAQIAPEGWKHRPLSLGFPRGVGLTDTRSGAAWIFAHPCGVRFAIVHDLLFVGRRP